MALTDIIKEIQKLDTADQLRLQEFFSVALFIKGARLFNKKRLDRILERINYGRKKNKI